MYVLTAKDNNDSPIPNYQFKIRLQYQNENVNGPINPIVTINGTPYILPFGSGYLAINDPLVTNNNGQTTVTVNYYGLGNPGVEYDINDWSGIQFLDSEGNQIFVGAY